MAQTISGFNVKNVFLAGEAKHPVYLRVYRFTYYSWDLTYA